MEDFLLVVVPAAFPEEARLLADFLAEDSLLVVVPVAFPEEARLLADFPAVVGLSKEGSATRQRVRR